MPTPPAIVKASINDRTLVVKLDTGEIVEMPLDHVPTLMLATPQERANMRVFTHSIAWDDLDCDLSVEGLMAGAKELPALAQKAWDRFYEKHYGKVAA